ncbi:MAG: ATP-dependent zinc metalloprotease FtsH [bacterium]|nr:ATP-dependent zinc metalloprotease FtsH [bacterium]
MAQKNESVTPKEKPAGGRWKGFLLYSVFALISLLIIFSLVNPIPGGTEVPLSTILNDVKSDKVKNLTIEANKITVKYKDDSEKVTYKDNESIVRVLEGSGIDPKSVGITVKDSSFGDAWIGLLTTVLPMLLIVGFFFIIFRQAKESQGSLFSFGQSRAKLFNKDQPRTKFSDVAGVDEAKAELEEVVEFLKVPEKFHALGARTPKGVLLVGPAGVGKTLLAKAVAGEANVAFFSVAGSEFMEMLVGVGASRVRDLFATAKKSGPAIIFIDEIDAIGRQRGNGFSGGHDEREQTLNQILVEMDGFAVNDNVIVLAATNRPDMLDKALLRPGRFDRIVHLDLPDINGRKELIRIHSRGKSMAKDIDFDRIARRTVGFSGADVENMLNEAAILAARQNKKVIDLIDIENAALKVKLGPERKRMQSEEDRRMTAYHEAGHAVAMWSMVHLDPVNRISIVSRGMALGFTTATPEQDRYNDTRTRLFELIAGMLGGRAAEKLVYNELTIGASNDLEKANGLARDMVTIYGMSSLGPISTEKRGSFGYNDFEQQSYSNELMSQIDKEVQAILRQCETMADNALATYRKGLDAVTDALMKEETIDADRFRDIMAEITGIVRGGEMKQVIPPGPAVVAQS